MRYATLAQSELQQFGNAEPPLRITWFCTCGNVAVVFCEADKPVPDLVTCEYCNRVFHVNAPLAAFDAEGVWLEERAW